MPNSFVDRFDLTIDNPEAKTRFVNRVFNEILWGFLLAPHFNDSSRYYIARSIATRLGDRFTNAGPTNMVGFDFLRNLQAVEAIYDSLGNSALRNMLSTIVEDLLSTSERDLGISWKDGRFYPSGAKLLDERLVNDVMKWLRETKYETVLAPFEKGLRHLLESDKRPELTADVVTDMYEALEALAKIVTNRTTSDLSANQEAFIAKVEASTQYKKLLRQYVEYANDFRHAPQGKSPRPAITPREAESFVYLTGLFTRLAMP
jgi:hypothetical protein